MPYFYFKLMIFEKLISRNYSNTYFIGEDINKIIIIDPSVNDKNRIVNHIKKMGYTIKAILLTHGHFDHIQAIDDILLNFGPIEIYINENEVEFLCDPKLNLSFYAAKEDDNINIINIQIKNTHLLFNDEEFNIDNFTIKAIHTPFHTEGSTCYYFVKEGLVFTGDTLFYSCIGRIDLPTGSKRTINSSLNKLACLQKETKVFPGHNVQTTIERELKYNMYLRNL